MNKARFEFLSITKADKALINKLCPKAEVILLSPLDKGLSGSTTLLAQWNMASTDTMSKFFVLKIGDAKKLKREHKAISNIASQIVTHLGSVSIKYSDDKKRAVLSQEFIGDDKGINKSLKQFIEQCNSEDDVERIINSLYQTEMNKWFKVPNADYISKDPKKISLGKIFQNWISKSKQGDSLRVIANHVGQKVLENRLKNTFSLSVEAMSDYIEGLYKEYIRIKKVPVHGDLHAQNVVLDVNNKICLIDFGWTSYRWAAIDFIWLECSLKFVVCSPHIRMKDYVYIEETLNRFWGREDEIPYETIRELYHGRDIIKMVKGVATIRKNARQLNVVNDYNDYLKGLIIMTNTLRTLEKLNRGILFMSLGVNIKKLKLDNKNNDQSNKKKVANMETTLKRTPPYDLLYQQTDLLWSDVPGRMVKSAARGLTIPGMCLDMGCGDGKNLLFLENLGWEVHGIDISTYAIKAAERRISKADLKLKGSINVKDVLAFNYEHEKYDLIVCYGLYHCLTDDEIVSIHTSMMNSVKRGGMIAFASLNDKLRVPDNHHTGDIYLRPENHIFGLMSPDFQVLERQMGTITESHPPLVGEHEHSLTWALFKKM